MPTPLILICSVVCYTNKLSKTRAPAIDVSGIVNGDALLLSVDAVAAASHKHSHNISGISTLPIINACRFSVRLKRRYEQRIAVSPTSDV